MAISASLRMLIYRPTCRLLLLQGTSARSALPTPPSFQAAREKNFQQRAKKSSPLAERDRSQDEAIPGVYTFNENFHEGSFTRAHASAAEAVLVFGGPVNKSRAGLAFCREEPLTILSALAQLRPMPCLHWDLKCVSF